MCLVVNLLMGSFHNESFRDLGPFVTGSFRDGHFHFVMGRFVCESLTVATILLRQNLFCAAPNKR
jgi:hypothetical protein